MNLDYLLYMVYSYIVRDSSAVRRLFVRLAGTVGRQSALHKENSGYAAPTLGRHIFTFRGYLILFSIRNPYINCLNQSFFYSFITILPSESGVTLDYCTISLTLSDFAISLSLSNICHGTSRKLRLPQCIMGDDLHI